MTGRLFGLDTVMVDVVMMIEELPRRGGDALSSRQVVTAGGGFNAMSAAARHGMIVSYGGRLGTGPFSEIAAEALASEGIAVPISRDPDRDLGFCLVLVEADGERTFVTAPGAEGGVTAAHLGGLDVDAGDYVFLSGYNVVYPQICANVLEWLATVPDAAIVVFDPGPRVMDIDAPARRLVLARTDWLLCNAEEAADLTGSPDPLVSAAALADRCRRGAVVRDGAAGCVVAGRDGVVERVSGFATTVVDTNGAGDTHDGVFLSELARHGDAVLGARLANAAAALAIARFGPATCPTRDEIARWYGEFL